MYDDLEFFAGGRASCIDDTRDVGASRPLTDRYSELCSIAIRAAGQAECPPLGARVQLSWPPSEITELAAAVCDAHALSEGELLVEDDSWPCRLVFKLDPAQ